MNIGEFTALDKEAQFKQASAIAGVEPSVFDGLWRTESGRGANMVSKAGAEGHFQLMPTTRATMEKRFGTTIDPYNFGQSLYTAAHLMKENLGRFKNLPDALRAYNGGWDKSKWGNPETATYARKVLGADADDSEIDASTALAAEGIGAFGVSRQSAAALSGQPFPGRATPPSKPSKAFDAVNKLTEALGGLAPTPAPGAPAFGSFAALAADQAKGTKDAADLRENTSFVDAMQASAFRSLPVVMLRALNRDPEPVVPGYTVPEEAFKGYSLDEQKELATASSPAQLERLKFDIAYGKEQDKITFANGTVFGLGATFLTMAPEAVLTGGLTSLAFKGAALGSVQLARAGNKAGAIASSAAEGIAGNIVNTAALDMLGERQGVNAYVLGAAGGLLNPLLAGRYLGRTADAAADIAHSERLVLQAAEKEAALMTRAQAKLGEGAEPGALRAEMDRIEAESIRANIASHKTAIPESRKMQAGTDLLDEAETEARMLESADRAPQAATMNEAKIAPRWESPSFHSDRQALLATNDEWKSNVKAVSDGLVDPDNLDALPRGVTVSPAAQADVTLRKPIADITELAEKYGLGRVVITNKVQGGESGLVQSFGDTHVIALKGGALPTNAKHTAWHELGHAVYHQYAKEAPAELIQRIDGEWRAFMAKAKAGDNAAWEKRWALTSPNKEARTVSDYTMSRDEYMAEQFVKHLQSNALAGNLGGKLTPGLIQSITSAVEALWNYVADLVRMGHLKSDKAADEFFMNVLENGFQRVKKGEEFMAPELRLPEMSEIASLDTAIPDALSKQVNDFLNDPEVQRSGLDRLPLGTPAERAEATQILALWKKARSPEYVVDEKRLNSILKAFPSLDPTSNMMLRSKNPVVRMAAIELLENGGGAGGRRSTASIAKWMNERAIVGNAIVEMDQSFKAWFKEQPGASNMDEAFTGRKRAEFNRLVAEEVEQRRTPAAMTDLGPQVRAAADTMEASFERARLMQVDAKTAGWGALPATSKGYMPHRMKSEVYRNLTPAQKKAVHANLTDQFITTSEFDPPFADELASKYLDRVEQRALGGFDAPMGLHQTGAADVIRESLEQMGMTRDQIDAAMKRHIRGAANHTKKRLDIDLRQTITAEDGSEFSLLDLYDTDMLSLLRGQSQRVSGEVALARHGVMGKPGLAIMRRAMGYGDAGEQAVAKEVGAFDQVSAEFLGQPFGEGGNKWVDRAVQFNSLSSLGGMGFNQLGEMINVGTTLGVKSALSVVSEFGRLRSEILGAARGVKASNGLLDSIETMGGAEFGTDAYKMVFPLDNPDLFQNSLGADSLSGADRLLRGGSHLQSKLSLWRTIHSAQVRGVAEQIVLKAAKALREGSADFHLKDMGIDDDIVQRLRKDMPNIVKLDNTGKVRSFDITKATDTEAAHAFIQGVHRGASQIIQGTFIGETGKYVHSSWLRMMTQFRTFSLTAIDKQWNRQVGNRGITGAVVVTLASMSVAAPIYMARTYLASIGRKDQDEYLERHLSFGAIARATTNYIATSGLAGDFLDAGTAITGTSEYTGGRSGTAATAVGNLFAPAAGKVDKLWGAVQNTKDGTDAAALLKEMPFSRLPFFIPAINALQDD